MQNYNVGILLYPQVELLDFTGPFEVFTATKDATGLDFFNVFTITAEEKSIVTKNGLEVISDYTFLFHPPIQILIIPGGDGSKEVIQLPAYLKWVQTVHENSMITASVCSGARILAKAGLLRDLTITTHHLVEEDVQSISPTTRIDNKQRFIEQGRLITSGGVSAGIDMSLYIIKKMLGGKTAEKTQKYLEYGNWREL